RLAGRLRRAQTALRVLGIDIAFTREGHSGTRLIRISLVARNTVGIVSRVGTGVGAGAGRIQVKSSCDMRANFLRQMSVCVSTVRTVCAPAQSITAAPSYRWVGGRQCGCLFKEFNH